MPDRSEPSPVTGLSPDRAGGGCYRRRIRLTATDEQTVVGDLEDDFHRFRVALTHDGERVVAVEGDAIRYPWTECPGALDPLHGVVGAALDLRAGVVARHTDPHANCTHLFDLASLAVTHAARTRDPQACRERVYDVVIPDRDGAWRTEPVLVVDGVEVLRWRVEAMDIVSPEPFAGQRLRGGFLRWAEALFDPEAAEAAAVLRRACEISFGRNTDWDALPAAIDVGEFMLGVCHTFQPERAEQALRIKGSVRDFSTSPGSLLA